MDPTRRPRIARSRRHLDAIAVVLLAHALALTTPAATPAATQDAPAPDAARASAAVTEQFALEADALPLLFDEPGDGRLWASGSTWKGSFGPEGFRYIPFFGSDAPRGFPVAFEPASVRFGAEPWSVARGAQPSREGETISFARGAFDEVYHLAADRVEQTFTFEQLAARTDLTIRIPVTTDLDVEAADGGFRFSGDHGSVRYGSATAIDAGGRRLTLEQRWRDGAIEILVPRAFVEDAALPLVVDPILQTFSITNDPRRQTDVDVAYDASFAVFTVVYSIAFNGQDDDVVCQSYDPINGQLGPAVSIDITAARWSRPRVASCFFQATFLFAAEVGPVGSDRDIWGRTRSAAGGSPGAQFQISIGSGDHHACDVGGYGNDANTSFSFMVVWQRDMPAGGDSDVLARGVTWFSTLVGNQKGIALGQAVAESAPAVSIRTGPQSFLTQDHQYLVVWEREVAPGDSEIWGRVVDFDVDVTGHPAFPVYTVNRATDPEVSSAAISPVSGNQVWMTIFERQVSNHLELFVVMTEEGNSDNARSIMQMQNLDLGDTQFDARIAFDGADYLVSYEQTPGIGATRYFTALNATPDSGELRSGLAERRAPIGLEDLGSRVTAIASQHEGGGPVGGRAMIAYVRSDLSTGETNVGGALAAEVSTTVRGAQYCPATPNSTGVSSWIRAGGGDFTTGTDVELRCVDLPRFSFGYFLVAPSSGFSANPGGSSGHLCLGGAIGRFSNSVASSGSAGTLNLDVDPLSLSSPTGAVSASAGEDWYFQCWHRDADGGVATSNFSNAVEVYFL